MNKPKLTQEIAYKALQGFFDNKPFIVFGTGTSCTVDNGFGMGALEKYLKDTLPICLNKAQQKEWQSVLNALAVKHDFEAALDAVKDQSLLKTIIDKTATHIANIDQKKSLEILNGTTTWPVIGIFKRLVERLPETDRTLHVATPNYDLLAEYAFTHANIPYCTGYWGGFIRKLDWKQAERQMTYIEQVSVGKRLQSYTRLKKHICLYKVHGSLNTFNINNEFVESNAWVWNCPTNYERLMITPGSSKHERLLHLRNTLLEEYDKAVKSHKAFLFLGFGFNDTQLVNNAIAEKLKIQAEHALIITRDCNDRIQEIINTSENAWLVCKHQDDGNETTRIFNSKYLDWLYLKEKKLWLFDEFATEIMG